MDPPRLRSEIGTVEGLLLRSAKPLEPPASAEDEIWKRLEVLGLVAAGAGAGAAVAASGMAAHAAASAGPKIAGKIAANAIWFSLVKWGILVSVGVLGVGAATRYVAHRKDASHDVLAQGATATQSVHPADTGVVSSPVIAPSASTPPAESITPPDPIAESSASPAARAPHRANRSDSSDARSALRAESLLLGAARSKLGAGDSQGALDDVARLRAQFPHGKLIQEREVVAIDSLVAQGNRAQAETRARSFIIRFPSSPYAEHVRSIANP